MRRVVPSTPLVVALLLAACGGDRAAVQLPEQAVEVRATVRFSVVEGNHWFLRAENGRDYLPRPDLPDELKVEGARVDVVLVERPEVVSIAPGLVADIIRIEPASCEHTCGAQPPPITLTVTSGATGGAVEGVGIQNLTGPPPVSPYPEPSASCAAGVLFSSCTVSGGIGAYAFDVTAPGFRTVHLEVLVPAWTYVPGVCCQPDYEWQERAVVLEPL